MALLDHCNIRTVDLAAAIRFYEEVIGLRTGPFPGAEGVGAWLYDERDIPIIHLISHEGPRRAAALESARGRLGPIVPEADLQSLSGGGAVDHVGLRCTDHAAVVARIEAHGVPYVTNDVPSFDLRQIFLNDPSGVTIELSFYGEAQPRQDVRHAEHAARD